MTICEGRVETIFANGLYLYPESIQASPIENEFSQFPAHPVLSGIA